MQSTTQTIQDTPQQSYILSLHAPSSVAAPNVWQLINIPERVNKLVQGILKSDLFTPEQKMFAEQWESHFIKLLNHANPLIPAKAVYFLGMKVITPALVLYKENRLASDQLIPLIRSQRELLTLLLPEQLEVEAFITQCEEVYQLMSETTMKLNSISAMNREIEQMMCQKALAMRETLLNHSNQSREMLLTLAQQWKSQITTIHTQLVQLTEKADGLNKKFQVHAHELETMGAQLTAEQTAFQKQIENLQNLLKKV